MFAVEICGSILWRMYEEAKPAFHPAAEKQHQSDDPGLIFYFNEAKKIHECLGLSSASQVDPPIPQGKKKILVPFCYYPHCVG